MVNPEASPDFMPTLPDVTAAYAGVRKHNAANVGFGAVFGGIIEVVEQETAADRAGEALPDQDAILEQARVTGDMEGELQSILYADTFARIGVDVMPVGSGKGTRQTSAKLVPVVRNATLFTEFLAGVTPGQMQGDDNHRKLLDDVASTLRDLVVTSETTETDDPYEKAQYNAFTEDSLRTFLSFEAEYRRLGVDGHLRSYERAYKDLDGYVTYWGRGVLAEHIQVGNSDVLSEPKTYYFDGMQAELVAKVDQILGLIGPERTTEYGIEAAGLMALSLERTLAMMGTPEGDWYKSNANRALLEDSIARLRSVVG